MFLQNRKRHYHPEDYDDKAQQRQRDNSNETYLQTIQQDRSMPVEWYFKSNCRHIHLINKKKSNRNLKEKNVYVHNVLKILVQSFGRSKESCTSLDQTLKNMFVFLTYLVIFRKMCLVLMTAYKWHALHNTTFLQNYSDALQVNFIQDSYGL